MTIGQCKAARRRFKAMRRWYPKDTSKALRKEQMKVENEKARRSRSVGKK